jgi:hypothetical protein
VQIPRYARDDTDPNLEILMRRLTAVAGLALLAACAKKDAVTDSTAAAPPAPPAPAAGVSITSPAEGDTVGTSPTFVLSGSGLTIEKAAGTKVEGVGHYHLYLDAAPGADGVVIPPNSATIVHIGTGDSTYKYPALTPGAHEVIAVVGYGDHSLMATRRDTVRFIVKK